MYAARVATALVLLPAALAAQEPMQQSNTIAVNATATVEQQPDRARLRIAVVSEGTTAAAASQANASQMTQVITALRESGITGNAVRTTSLQIHPQYSSRSPGDAPRIVGYSATNMVEATIDSIARIGAITDAVISAGANRVAGVSFELRNPDAARAEALTRAVTKSRMEAEAVAAAAERALGPVLTVTVEPDHGMPMFRDFSARAEMAQAAETPVEPGTIQVSASVRVVYVLSSR
jgi:uncharacterized protein YggE